MKNKTICTGDMKALIILSALATLLTAGASSASCLTSKSAGRECTAGQKAIVVGALAAVTDKVFDTPWVGAGIGIGGVVVREAAQGALGSNDSNWDIGGAIFGGVVTSLLLDDVTDDGPYRLRYANTINGQPVSAGLVYELRF